MTIRNAEASADHIVWGTLESSTGSMDSGSEKLHARSSRQHLVENVLQMSSQEDSFSSELVPERVSNVSTNHHRKTKDVKEGMQKWAHMFSNKGQSARVEDPFEADDQDEGPGLHQSDQLGLAGAHQALVRQGLDVESLVRQVPCNERGLLTSIGSIGHSNQTCKDVCPFINKPQGCQNGIYCNRCHFSHGLRKRKVKDGKSKRDRYRKLKEDMMRQIEERPDDFQFDFDSLPDCIAKDERLIGKLLNRLRIHQDETKHKQLVDL
jgi:hypothetical protein